jgi:hypothetical protein
MKTSASNNSIEKTMQRSSSLNNAITANTNSIIVDDLESLSVNKVFVNQKMIDSESKLFNIQTEIRQQAYKVSKADDGPNKHLLDV